MNKSPSLLKTALTLAICTSSYSAQAFNTGDVLSFNPGVTRCLVGGIYPSCDYGATEVNGSYFSMDTNGDGVFANNERIPISSGPIGGIIIGLLQPASGSHAGCPDGSESAGPDAPWCFFGNTGMHQVTGTPVTDNGDGTLNFTGWGVAWNGIANIPMGGDPANFASDTGNAIVNCSSTPCQPGDTYNLDYVSHVPFGDPSSFGGIGYSLHLEGITPEPAAFILMSIEGGESQECNSTGGNNISITATTTVSPDDAISSINWSVDGTAVASGDNLQQFFTLGGHSVQAILTTVNGLSSTASSNIMISDTTPPVVSAAFVSHRNRPLHEVKHIGKVKIQAEAEDICDAEPSVNAMIGAPVEDGDKIKVGKHNGSVKLDVPSLTLSVYAADSSGNSASAGASLLITD